MNLHVSPTATGATRDAADWFAARLQSPETRNVMLAGGNTPLALYRQITRRRPPLAHLHIFALDEYVGVPMEEPRTCANLIRRTVIEPWGIPEARYHPVSSLETEAGQSIERHEMTIRATGGLDVLILGLGKNAHIGFNEPGSAADSIGRVVPLTPTSIDANREWFGGQHAPDRGVTTGMKTLLEARAILLLAFGAAKSAAVEAMLNGPQTTDCPASFLQGHPDTHIFLDTAAGASIAKTSLGRATAEPVSQENR